MINQAIKADENRWSKSWEYAVDGHGRHWGLFNLCL